MSRAVARPIDACLGRPVLPSSSPPPSVLVCAILLICAARVDSDRVPFGAASGAERPERPGFGAAFTGVPLTKVGPTGPRITFHPGPWMSGDAAGGGAGNRGDVSGPADPVSLPTLGRAQADIVLPPSHIDPDVLFNVLLGKAAWASVLRSPRALHCMGVSAPACLATTSVSSSSLSPPPSRCTLPPPRCPMVAVDTAPPELLPPPWKSTSVAPSSSCVGTSWLPFGGVRHRGNAPAAAKTPMMPTKSTTAAVTNNRAIVELVRTIRTSCGLLGGSAGGDTGEGDTGSGGGRIGEGGAEGGDSGWGGGSDGNGELGSGGGRNGGIGGAAGGGQWARKETGGHSSIRSPSCSTLDELMPTLQCRRSLHCQFSTSLMIASCLRVVGEKTSSAWQPSWLHTSNVGVAPVFGSFPTLTNISRSISHVATEMVRK
eukprot:5306442-Prymnesium_polylepis.2